MILDPCHIMGWQRGFFANPLAQNSAWGCMPQADPLLQTLGEIQVHQDLDPVWHRVPSAPKFEQLVCG